MRVATETIYQVIYTPHPGVLQRLLEPRLSTPMDSFMGVWSPPMPSISSHITPHFLHLELETAHVLRAESSALNRYDDILASEPEAPPRRCLLFFFGESQVALRQ